MSFARYGVQAQLVSDNGPQLKSEEFEQFLKRNGIKHITSAPYHPATNGLAECYVESFKNGMKSETEMKSLNIKLAKFLLAYRMLHTQPQESLHPSCFWEEDYALGWTC